MPRRPKQPPIQCKYYSWHLRQRAHAYYADGRMNKPRLGKHSLGTRDRDEAVTRLHQLDHQKAIEYGLAEEVSKAESNTSITIVDGWKKYFARCEEPEILGGVTIATRKRYKAVQDKHIEYCRTAGITDWREVDKKKTVQYGGWLRRVKLLADRSIIFECNLVVSVVKWLVEENFLPPQCRFLLKLSKPDGTNTYCYTKDQVTRMIAYCYVEPGLEWLGNVIATLATTGLRINELAMLRWTDIDFAAGSICITDERARPRRRQSGLERRLKSKRGRALPLNLSLRKLLLGLPRHQDGLVIRAKNGGKLKDRRVLETLQRKVIRSLVGEFPTPGGEIGFEHGTVHGLRHYFVSEAYRNGATDAELVDWLGHRDSQLLRVYRHLRPEDGRRKMLKIDFLGSSEDSKHPRNTA